MDYIMRPVSFCNYGFSQGQFNYKNIIYTYHQHMKSILIAVIAVFLGALVEAKQLKQSKVITALNCGMSQGSVKVDNIQFEGDSKYVKGNSVDVDYHSDSAASAADIKYAIDKELYMFERHTYQEMVYQLPIKSGTHTLILKFAEMYFQKKQQRVFNIKIGNKIIVQNMDVFAKAGSKYAAHEEYIEIQVKAGDVYFNGEKVINGIKGNKLQLIFSKGKADNPIIQAIILYHGPISETTKADYEELKRNWNSKEQMLKAKKQQAKVKELIAMTKKKEKIIIRNDQILLQNQNKGKEEAIKAEKFGPIRSFLMSPIGILIWTAIIIYKVLYIYNNVLKIGSKKPIKTSTEA